MRGRTWMIYGANGYTGALIAEEAVRRGMHPILAGRNGNAISRLGNRTNLETRVFALDNPNVVTENLCDVDVVLHCAGPFSATSHLMLEGCVRAKTHYLDITGEIDVFEMCHTRDADWVDARIVVIPGVGMDIVPTDCLAVMVHHVIQKPTHLMLALKMGVSSISPGTAKTVVEGLPYGARARRDGVLTTLPTASKMRLVKFGTCEENAVLVPWGDVATAYYSTGIPNIEVYFGLPASTIRAMRFAARFSWLTKQDAVQTLLKKLVDAKIQGPDPDARARGETLIVAEVANEAGECFTKRMRVPEGYTFTVHSAIAAVDALFEEDIDPGFFTPALAFGEHFVLGIDGVEVY